jgi:hypothetical protein
MRRVLVACVLVLLTASVGSAQFVVNDPAVTFRNTITAVLNAYLVATQRNQRLQLLRMAQRLSLVTGLNKYRLLDVPEWRIHLLPYPAYTPLTTSLESALTYGDPSGFAWGASTDPLAADAASLARLSPGARQAVLPRLATVDLTDATGMAAMNDTGQLRFNGRRELAAINALETDVLNPSPDHSTTAVLDKLSGASLVGARQRQTRLQLLAGILEQLLIDSKRTRDSESTTLNMQTRQWQTGSAANDAFVAGTGDALRTWRQR